MQYTIPEAPYRINEVSRAMTPALAIYPEIVDSNIEATLRLLGGDANRWRPHVKTAKLAFTIRRMIDRGIRAVKCATTLELVTSCESGASDALLAYPVVGANAIRVRDIAAEYSDRTKISVLVETPEQAALWEGSKIGVFIDVNSGMNRTGIEQDRVKEVVALAKALGSNFRGLHYYDGHMHIEDPDERRKAAWKGYDKLMELVEACDGTVGEIITSGTPALMCGANYPGFRSKQFVHRVSPGTVVYCDTTSMQDLPPDAGYRPAVAVVASVVSHPLPGRRFTCDAGHKSVSADAGVPTCAVAGHAGFQPLKPSEEHLPVDVLEGETLPAIGDYLYLIPRHVCPTVNNFDEALIVEKGEITGVEMVTARGRESLLV